MVAIEILVQRGEGLAHLGCGADRPQRIVLMDLGNPEDGHDGVADELLDGATVVFDRGLHRVEVAFHDVTERFRVERLTHRRRAHHVAEHDRDGLANLRGAFGRGEGCGALPAELVRLGVVVSAHLTLNHPRSLGLSVHRC